MNIFSNGQFDINRKIYIFKATPIGKKIKYRFLPIEGSVVPKDQLALEYSSKGPYVHPRRQDNKFFTLRLHANGKLVDTLTDECIEKAGNNDQYETAIRVMLARAIELSKRGGNGGLLDGVSTFLSNEL